MGLATRAASARRDERAAPAPPLLRGRPAPPRPAPPAARARARGSTPAGSMRHLQAWLRYQRGAACRRRPRPRRGALRDLMARHAHAAYRGRLSRAAAATPSARSSAASPASRGAAPPAGSRSRSSAHRDPSSPSLRPCPCAVHRASYDGLQSLTTRIYFASPTCWPTPAPHSSSTLRHVLVDDSDLNGLSSPRRPALAAPGSSCRRRRPLITAAAGDRGAFLESTADAAMPHSTRTRCAPTILSGRWWRQDPVVAHNEVREAKDTGARGSAGRRRAVHSGAVWPGSAAALRDFLTPEWPGWAATGAPWRAVRYRSQQFLSRCPGRRGIPRSGAWSAPSSRTRRHAARASSDLVRAPDGLWAALGLLNRPTVRAAPAVGASHAGVVDGCEAAGPEHPAGPRPLTGRVEWSRLRSQAASPPRDLVWKVSRASASTTSGRGGRRRRADGPSDGAAPSGPRLPAPVREKYADPEAYLAPGQFARRRERPGVATTRSLARVRGGTARHRNHPRAKGASTLVVIPTTTATSHGGPPRGREERAWSTSGPRAPPGLVRGNVPGSSPLLRELVDHRADET